MKKILVVRSDTASTWVSCNIIADNLFASYKLLEGEFEIKCLELPDNFDDNYVSNFEVLKNASKEILEYKPDYFVFLHHLPLPPVVLTWLLTIDRNLPIGEVIIHVYGDLTYYLKQWANFFENFADFTAIKFVAASKSQARLLTYLLGKEATVIKGYFPVSNAFFFDNKKRRVARSLYGLSEDEHVFVYAGRISAQKNVDLLIKAFAQYCSLHPEKKMQLLVAGHYDNVGCKFSSLDIFDGYQFQKIQETVSEIPQETRGCIRLLGGLGMQDLDALYQAADSFVSLSIYHDEDYGMAVAEALSAGIASIISDWGGYSSFIGRDEEWICDLVPVSFDNVEYSFLENDIFKLFDASINRIDDRFKRKKRAEHFYSNFSVENFSSLLKTEILTDPANSHISAGGIERYMLISDNKLREKNDRRYNHHFTPRDHSIYNEIYSNYVKSESK